MTTYTHGHHDSVLRSHRWRTAENSAAFLLPHLPAGGVLLDVGCGPGTITLDLARLLPAGHVVAIDRAAAPLAGVRQSAIAHDLGNVSVAVADAYALPMATGSVDVVHAHQVLQHLTDPVAALREWARVCRPGGMIAARDADYAGFTWWPPDARLDAWLALYRACARDNGAEPDAGRRLLSWAHAAGLRDVVATAGVWCFASAEDRAWWSGTWAERVTGSALADQALASGRATRDDLADMAAAFRQWGDADDGWFLVPHGEVLVRLGSRS